MKKLYKGDESQRYQGDVSIIRLESAPDLAFTPLNEPLVVAEGEVTGHKHVITAEPETKLEFAKDNNGYYLKVRGRAILRHEEHEVQTLDTGVYFLGVQWEYDEIQERKVAD